MVTGLTGAGPTLAAAVCIDGRSKLLPCSWVWPTVTGVIVRGVPPKA
jgi:hypothetical protein